MSRTKRRERRQRHFALPIGVGLFLVFTLVIVLIFGAVWALVEQSRLDSLQQRAELQLAGKCDVLSARLDQALNPAKAVFQTIRAELDRAAELDVEQVRPHLIHLLQGCPQLQRLRLPGHFEMARDGDTWLLRRSGGDATIWERWDSTGANALSQQPGDPWGEDAVLPSMVPNWPRIESASSGHACIIVQSSLQHLGLLQASIELATLQDKSAEANWLVLHPSGEVVAAAGDDSLKPAMNLKESHAATASPLAIAARKGESLHALNDLHSLRLGTELWWFATLHYPLDTDENLTLLAGAPEGALAVDDTRLRNRLLGGALAAWAFAAMAAWLLGRSFAKPFKNFAKRARRIDLIERSLGGRPYSRWREVDGLYEKLEEISEEVAEVVHSRELPIVLTAEPMRKGISTTDAMLIHAASTPPAVAAGTPAEAETPEVPEAYLQAIQSSRRKLRRATEELEAQRKATKGIEHKSEEEGLQWNKSRDAAAALSSLLGEHAHDFDAFATACAEHVAQAVEALRCGVWLPDGRREMRRMTLHAQHLRAGDAEEHSGFILPRTGHLLLFNSLEQNPCISVRDAALDPRSASYAADVPWEPKPGGMIAAAARDAQGIVAVLTLERTSTAAWPVAAEALACMAAGALAAAWELSQRPRPHREPEPEPEPQEHDEYTEPPLYRQLLEAQRGAVLALDRQGKVTFANAAAEKLYGRPAHQWPGTAFTELAASGYALRDGQALQRVLAGEDRVDIDSEHVTATGSTALRLTWAPLEDEEGEITGAVVLAVDIKDIKDHTGELKRAEARFRGYVENLPGVVFSVDTIGCINYVSPAVQQIYGHNATELTGVSAGLVADEAHAEQDRDALATLLQRGECTGYETLHRTRDGLDLPVTIHASVRRDSEGQIAGAIGVAIPRARHHEEK